LSKRVPAILFLAGALLTAACSRAEKTGPRPLNVILVVVDTLRADHLGVYGYSRKTSPNVDAFARRSVLFQNARSQASCTFPSVNSILTSRYPITFLGQPGQALGIPAAIPSIAEILSARGYRTVAVSASTIVRSTPSRRNPSGGFGRGFDLFLEDCQWKPAHCVNRHALSQLAAGGRRDDDPLFLYLHYIDPHDPYAPPAGHPRRFAQGRPEKDWVRRGNPNPIGDHLYVGAPDPRATPADVQHLRDLYDDEIAYFDSQFAELLRTLESGGWLEDSIVVFAADHGEEFLEHKDVKHCRTVYDSLIRTPLFIHLPGVAGKAVPAPVQNLDIVPTLLDYLGIPAGPAKLEGESLRPLIEKGTPGEPFQYSLAGPYRAVADGRFKLIEHLARRDFQLFDLQGDPGETKDIRDTDRRTLHRLRGELDAWMKRVDGGTDESLQKTREAQERLRSLGYLQ
jgi:arylsulfatase A-like enzyme